MKTKIIAELCQNHLGSRELLHKMVSEVAESGADYCKIQSMRVEDLTFRKRFELGEKSGNKIKTIKRPYEAEYNRLAPLDLSDDDHKYFIDICRENNVLPLTTVFTRNRVEFLSKLDWGHRKIKVASFDCRSKPLLRDLFEAGFDHLIISTGSTYNEEIEETANFLKDLGCKFSFLHCVSIYPTPVSEGHLSRIEYLRKFTESVGFSEHSNFESDGLKLSTLALTKNIDWVERHFTSVEKSKTKDGIVSLDKVQMSDLVRRSNMSLKDLQLLIDKEISKEDQDLMMGDVNRKLSEIEILNRDYYHGRFASKSKDGKILFNWE